MIEIIKPENKLIEAYGQCIHLKNMPIAISKADKAPELFKARLNQID